MNYISYVYGNDIDEVLRMTRGVDGTGGPEDYYYHQDDLFNVVALTDQSGDVVERYEYGDYGAPEVYAPKRHAALRDGLRKPLPVPGPSIRRGERALLLPRALP